MTDEAKALVERLRSVDISWSETGEWCAEAADCIEEQDRHLTLSGKVSKALSERIEALEAEVERLREALGDLIEAVQRRTADLGGYDGRFGLNKSIVKARAALGESHD